MIEKLNVTFFENYFFGGKNVKERLEYIFQYLNVST